MTFYYILLQKLFMSKNIYISLIISYDYDSNTDSILKPGLKLKNRVKTHLAGAWSGS